MKIIACSNFADETQSDRLVADGIMDATEAVIMVNALNMSSGQHSRDYYRAVEDNHPLYVWEP